jgi:hypothetical protein
MKIKVFTRDAVVEASGYYEDLINLLSILPLDQMRSTLVINQNGFAVLCWERASA